MQALQMLIDWVMTPLAYNFMQRGMLAAVMVGVLCAILGCYVVLRSMAFLGDAMAHAVLPGVAIAYLLGGNLLFGALAAAVVVALGHRLLLAQGRDQGGHGDWHPVYGGAGAGDCLDQQHPHLCRGPQPHPVWQRAGREPDGSLDHGRSWVWRFSSPRCWPTSRSC